MLLEKCSEAGEIIWPIPLRVPNKRGGQSRILVGARLCCHRHQRYLKYSGSKNLFLGRIRRKADTSGLACGGGRLKRNQRQQQTCADYRRFSEANGEVR